MFRFTHPTLYSQTILEFLEHLEHLDRPTLTGNHTASTASRALGEASV
jgi:hypothetical protein